MVVESVTKIKIDRRCPRCINGTMFSESGYKSCINCGFTIYLEEETKKGGQRIMLLKPNNQNKQYGFTLIGLLIVIAFVSVLAATAIPLINRYLEQKEYWMPSENLSAGNVEIPCDTIETDIHGNVIATQFYENLFGKATRVYFADNSSIELSGRFNLMLGSTYTFSFYDGEWHISGVLLDLRYVND